jgi:excisionase family DNA binding protein
VDIITCVSQTPLYVRLPNEQAARLDAAVRELKASKRELISTLVARHLDDVVLGHHEFRPDPPADVLTAEQAAALLQVEQELVEQLAEKGELPGRLLGGEWRFARAALLRWVEGA